jgi:hypothetical protein
MSAIDMWDLAHRGRKITQVMLRRGAAISAELLAVAEAARRRIADIPDDLAGEGSTPAVWASPKKP